MPDKFQQLLDITDEPLNQSEEHISEVFKTRKPLRTMR